MTKPDAKTFAGRLQLAAEYARVPYSQSAIGNAIGSVDRRTVDRWFGTGLPSATQLFKISDAFKVDARWLATGEGDMVPSGPRDALPAEEAQLLSDYNKANEGWQLTLRLLARTPPEDQPELSRNMNILMTTIFGKAVPDDRLGDRWTRPDKKKVVR